MSDERHRSTRMYRKRAKLDAIRRWRLCVEIESRLSLLDHVNTDSLLYSRKCTPVLCQWHDMTKEANRLRDLHCKVDFKRVVKRKAAVFLDWWWRYTMEAEASEFLRELTATTKLWKDALLFWRCYTREKLKKEKKTIRKACIRSFCICGDS